MSFLGLLTRRFQTILFTQIIQHLEDVPHLEIKGLADQVGTIPAYGHVGMTAFRADNRFNPELVSNINNTLNQFSCYIRNTDLDTAIGRFKSFR